MKFSKLAVYLEKLEKTASRNDMTELLANLFKKVGTNDIDKVTFMILGQIAPRYEEVVFNIAERMMQQAIAEAYNVEVQKVRVLYKRKGDLGEVAQELAGQRKSKMSVSQVFERLVEIAEDEGEGSQERKVKKTASLLRQLDRLSVRYVARIPIGKLRLGFSDKTILDALSWMVKGDKSETNKLDRAYNVYPNVGFIARQVKEKGVEKTVKGIRPKVGVPILPMLAQRLKSPSEMIKKMGEVYIEPKFDGLRIQIHFKSKGFGGKDGKVRCFTRNLNETSWMFPELKDAGSYINAKEAIFDCEAVGVDEERKSMANFQKTMTRRRKHNIEEISKKVAIKFHVFDLMYKDGTSLIEKSYDDRRKVLAKALKNGKLFEVVEYEKTKDPDVIRAWMKKELKEGMEGIIVKKANSHYIAGRTGWRWVKMKEEESARTKLADTIHCIIMGYYSGRGKRTSFGLGGFLVGVARGDSIVTLTKIGTGLTDEQFKELHKRLIKIEAEEKPKEYGKVDKTLIPDVWVEPDQVVEIAADEITKSPIHSAGLALRFPRLVHFRDDKSADEATTLKEVKKLYKMQK